MRADRRYAAAVEADSARWEVIDLNHFDWLEPKTVAIAACQADALATARSLNAWNLALCGERADTPKAAQ